MKIALLSDTHGFVDQKLLTLCEGVDEIWHAGDIGTLAVTDALGEVAKVRAVYGNIDGSSIRAVWPLHQRFVADEMDIWITHIGGYPNRYAPGIRPQLIAHKPDVFITGHSHILKVMHDKKLGVFHLNPGAIGKQGFHKVRTMLRFQVHGKKMEHMEVVELPRW
jgi:putative phosphoesterase